MIFSFSVGLFIASIMVVQNRTALDYAPIACDGRVRCKHLSIVYVSLLFNPIHYGGGGVKSVYVNSNFGVRFLTTD